MAATQTLRAGDFLDSMGVATHIDYTDGGYSNLPKVLQSLNYLGIEHVRDHAPNPASDAYGQTHLGDAANAGVKFVFAAQGNVDPQTVLQRLHAFVQAHPGAITGIEGPNEVNNWPVSFAGLTGTAGAQAYQKALLDGANADPLLKDIPVLGFTDYPVHASASDWNNTHPYPKNGDQPYATVLSNRDGQLSVDPGKPFAITEMGYHTSLTADTSGGWEGVDEATQAKLVLNAYVDAARAGSKATYVYQLLDAYADTAGSDQEKHFGLFRLDYSPKPAATAIHNLTSILDDPGAAAHTFSTGTLAYSVAGLPSTGASLLMQKSSGTYDLVLWNEPDIWDQAADRPIATATQSVTVDLGGTFGSVKVFDPLKGTAPVQEFSNVGSVQLALTDHPLVVELGSASTASPAPTPTSPVPTTPTPTDPVPTTPVPTTPVPDPVQPPVAGRTINGTDSRNTIDGTAGNDTIYALGGNDVVRGGAGDDVITGGRGADVLSGQAGNDLFVYTSRWDSSRTYGRDTILSWGQGGADGDDRIDLHLIDADTTLTGNQAFKWLGGAAFSGKPGELRSWFDGTNTVVEANLNTNIGADLQIKIAGNVTLHGEDFVL